VRGSLFAAVVLGVTHLGAPGAHAEPGPVIKYLMDEPASLFTVGLIQADTWMKETFSAQGQHGFASYDWDSNRISFGIIILDGDAAPDPRSQCGGLIWKVRRALGINPDTGKYLINDWTMLSTFFSQRGYQSGGQPDDLYERLLQVTEVTAIVPGKASNKPIKCKGPLLSSETLFTE
jgi:hypothetical protein